MMKIETRLGAQLESYLDLTASHAKLTVSNIANIDTPGYRALGFDFANEMKRALAACESGRKLRLHPQEIDGLISRPDGNNVSMDREALNLAEDQLKFGTGVALLLLENQRVLSALRDDK